MKHPVVVRRTARVYEALRTSREVLATVYEALGASDAESSARLRTSYHIPAQFTPRWIENRVL